jgi:hypothetical protein
VVFDDFYSLLFIFLHHGCVTLNVGKHDCGKLALL